MRSMSFSFGANKKSHGFNRAMFFELIIRLAKMLYYTEPSEENYQVYSGDGKLLVVDSINMT